MKDLIASIAVLSILALVLSMGQSVLVQVIKNLIETDNEDNI